MLGRSAQYMEQAPFLVIFPGLATVLTVPAFNVRGDAVSDALGAPAPGSAEPAVRLGT